MPGRIREAVSAVRVIAHGTLRRYVDARGLDLAASLAYASLLTIVPLVAAVTILTSTLFGSSGTGLYRLMRWVVPGASRELVEQLRLFSAKAASLTGFASLFFLVTSLRTYFLVEGAAQALWGTTVRRVRPLRRVGIGMTVMILGPIAIGVITSTLLESGASFTEFRFLGYLFTAVLLALLYRVLPGAYVRWGPALVAAAVVAYGITMLRVAFTRGVARLDALSKTYGPVSVGVIFLIAIGFAFTLFLLGMSLAHAIQYRRELLFHDVPAQKMDESGPLYESVLVLLELAMAWRNDRAPRTERALAYVTKRPEEEIRPLLERLEADGIVCARTPHEWVLTRPPETISLWAIARAIGESALRPVPAGDDRVSTTLRRVFSKANREERGVLQGTSLRDLLKPPEA